MVSDCARLNFSRKLARLGLSCDAPEEETGPNNNWRTVRMSISVANFKSKYSLHRVCWRASRWRDDRHHQVRVWCAGRHLGENAMILRVRSPTSTVKKSSTGRE